MVVLISALDMKSKCRCGNCHGVVKVFVLIRTDQVRVSANRCGVLCD